MTVRYQRAADLVELTGILQSSVAGLTIDQIAERFEVSRRTAERMLSALRQRFPDLRPELRAGRKHWRLPDSGPARPLQLPRTIDALSERIAELEAEVTASRSELEELRCIAEGVFATAGVGLMILDPKGRVVRTNDTLAALLGIDASELVGHELPKLFDGPLHGTFSDGEGVLHRLRGAASRVEKGFRCHVPAHAGRPERWLRAWGRAITDGPLAGGRIDRWLEIGPAEMAPERTAASESLPENSSPMLEQHLASIQQAIDEALSERELPEPVRRRLCALHEANTATIQTSVELMRSSGTKREVMSPGPALDLARLMIEPHASRHGGSITVDAPEGLPPMYGDRAVALSSLVLNAKITVEALPEGAKLVLRARALESPPRMRISLIDDGPSLPDEFPAFQGAFYPTRDGGLAIGVQPARAGGPGVEQYFELPIP